MIQDQVSREKEEDSVLSRTIRDAPDNERKIRGME